MAPWFGGDSAWEQENLVISRSPWEYLCKKVDKLTPLGGSFRPSFLVLLAVMNITNTWSKCSNQVNSSSTQSKRKPCLRAASIPLQSTLLK
jgi:hypothetical protein